MLCKALLTAIKRNSENGNDNNSGSEVILSSLLTYIVWVYNSTGAPLAQFIECQTLDRKVTSSNLTRGAVLCP